MMRALMMLTLTLTLTTAARADVVGAWLLDDDATDASGNGFDGVVVGNVPWVDGKHGQGGNFTPSNYIDFPQKPNALNLTRDFTVMVWAMPNQFIGGWNGIFSMQAGVTGRETYGIYYGNNGGGEFILWTSIGGASKSVTTGKGGVAVKELAHCAVSYDGAALKLYKNGEFVAETAVQGDLENSAGGRFVINGNYNTADGGLSEFSDCMIDEVLVYDEALSQDEIRNLMENGFEGTRAVEPGGKATSTWGSLKAAR
ncbi:MAG: LamG domain-containing protein [Candidatus Poribacteria bacterium]|nr:LamG domain-containing protein [Candidatus Poribacteria bacterium]